MKRKYTSAPYFVGVNAISSICWSLNDYNHHGRVDEREGQSRFFEIWFTRPISPQVVCAERYWSGDLFDAIFSGKMFGNKLVMPVWKPCSQIKKSWFCLTNSSVPMGYDRCFDENRYKILLLTKFWEIRQLWQFEIFQQRPSACAPWACACTKRCTVNLIQPHFCT